MMILKKITLTWVQNKVQSLLLHIDVALCSQYLPAKRSFLSFVAIAQSQWYCERISPSGVWTLVVTHFPPFKHTWSSLLPHCSTRASHKRPRKPLRQLQNIWSSDSSRYHGWFWSAAWPFAVVPTKQIPSFLQSRVHSGTESFLYFIYRMVGLWYRKNKCLRGEHFERCNSIAKLDDLRCGIPIYEVLRQKVLTSQLYPSHPSSQKQGWEDNSLRRE